MMKNKHNEKLQKFFAYCSDTCSGLDRGKRKAWRKTAQGAKTPPHETFHAEVALAATAAEAAECYVSEKKMARYLDRVKLDPREWDPATPHASDAHNEKAHERVDVNPALPPKVAAALMKLNEKYKVAFQINDRGLCKQLKVPPVTIKMKPNAKPCMVKHQKFGPHTSKLAAHLAKVHVKTGLLEPAPETAWASRTHFALKAAAGERLDGPNHKIRECGDYRAVNERIEKVVPNIPKGEDLVREVAKLSHFIESDWHSAHNSIGLDEQSRNVLARHTPIGIMRPTRLQFGSKNAQAHFFATKMALYEKHLHENTRSLLYSYIDDDRSGKLPTEPWSAFLKRWEDILSCVVEVNGTLRAEKTRLGYQTTVFFGRKIENGQSCTAEKNPQPLRDMQPPTDLGELRRVLRWACLHSQNRTSETTH